MPRRRQALGSSEALVVEAMGRLAETWGLRRNLGRCWAVLFLHGRPLSSTELQRMLELSTGAVSMTVQELQRWGVIRRVHRPEDRRKHYVAEVDVWRVVSRLLRARELSEIDNAVDSLEEALRALRARQVSTPDEQVELNGRVRRVEGLLDLLRVVSSLVRGLVTTARLDATLLAAFRLGGDDDEV